MAFILLFIMKKSLTNLLKKMVWAILKKSPGTYVILHILIDIYIHTMGIF